MLAAYTNWRRPELAGVSVRGKAPKRRHRVAAAVLGALWAASMTGVGLALLSPARDVAVSIWLPHLRWRVRARLVTMTLVVALAVFGVPAAAAWFLFGTDPYIVMGIIWLMFPPSLLYVRLAGRRLRRSAGRAQLPGMVSINGLASRSRTTWDPSRFLRKQLLPWAEDHNVALYAAAASEAHVRLFRRAGFVPAPEHGPLALIRPPAAEAYSTGHPPAT